MGCLTLAAVGLHLASVHSRGGYTDINPGVYVESECGVMIGAFRNSYGNFSAQLAYRLEPKKLPVFVEAGLATGYPGHDVQPYAMGGVRVGPVRIGYIPHISGVNRCAMAHAMVQFRL